jgi:hypothetical protein
MKTIFLILAATVPLLADYVVVDTSPHNDNATDIVNSRLAADFTLTSGAVIDDMTFWYQAQFQTDLSSVAYAFYSDTGGGLGMAIDTGVVTPETSPTDTNAFIATFSIPDVSLGAGTYWLELHAGSSLTDNSNFEIWWAASDNTGPYSALQDVGLGQPSTPVTISGYEQYAFQLAGTSSGGGVGGSPVAEPSTLLLAAVALAVLKIVKRNIS